MEKNFSLSLRVVFGECDMAQVIVYQLWPVTVSSILKVLYGKG